jgi:hypothetical protein
MAMFQICNFSLRGTLADAKLAVHHFPPEFHLPFHRAFSHWALMVARIGPGRVWGFQTVIADTMATQVRGTCRDLDFIADDCRRHIRGQSLKLPGTNRRTIWEVTSSLGSSALGRRFPCLVCYSPRIAIDPELLPNWQMVLPKSRYETIPPL